MDPFAFLEEDHKKVAKLLKALENTTERAEKTREVIHEELDASLTLHAKIEEAVVYPVLKEKQKTHELTLEAIEEHEIIKTLLKELAGMPENSEVWSAKLKVLKEMVEHHVEEEEKELFPKARKMLSTEESNRIGTEIQKMLTAGL